MDDSTLVVPQELDGDAPPALPCPDCDYVAEGAGAKAKLGGHRFAVHGIRGESARSDRRHREPSQPRAPRQPAIKTTIRNNVKMTYGLGSVLAAPLLPNAAGAARANLDQIADAWAACSDEPWVRELWGQTGQATKWIALGMAHLPLAAAGLVDIQQRRAARAERRAAEEEERTGEYPPYAEPGEPFGGDQTNPAAA